MPSSADITFDGPVATIPLVPDGPVTSLSRALAADIDGALDALDDNPQARCVVLVGTGKTFIAGADIKQIHDQSVEENLDYNQLLIDLCNRFDALDLPVVVGLNGHAFGGGLELALACTLRVMADDALVGLPEVKVGILPGSGGVVRLPREVGRGNALSIILTGRGVPAQEALAIGLVQEVVPADDVAGRAHEIATVIASRAPLAVQTVTRAARDVALLPVEEGVQLVHERLATLLPTHDAGEGIAAFLEKRPPDFTAS